LYLSIGAAAVLMLIVPMFIAREVFASYMRIKESHEETVGMLIRALEAKDRYTSGHSERVATYARYIGEELNFMPARLERLRFAALMHDIGKLVVPNQLLNKPGRLTPEEFEKVRIHEKVSVQMLSHIDFLRPIAGSGHSDNTRFDPDDPDHPIEPYIVMIADAYDAMTSTRSYRKALSQETAFQELRDKAGIQFHPDCVDALIQAIEKRGERHGAGYEQNAQFDGAPDMGVGSAGLGDLLPSEASTT
jgi:HD-GYP domain-containing protein (c-di-GMP phosphodiesterase class II)